jgi:hypothetical protein
MDMLERSIGRAVLLAALFAAASAAALAETTVLRGPPPRDTNPAPQTDNNLVNTPSGGRTPDVQSGTANSVRTGSANAGGEIANPPPGLVPGLQNPNRP